MLVEFDGLPVFQFGVGKEGPLQWLPLGQLEDGLGGHPLVDVQGDGVYLEVVLLALAGPFQPGVVVAEGVGQHLGLFFVQRALLGLGQQIGQVVGLACVVEAQEGGQVGIVSIAGLGDLLHLALGGQAGRGNVLAFVGVTVIGDLLSVVG